MEPKNGVTNRAILCDFGSPWRVVAMWSPAESKWVAATIQSSKLLGDDDNYFENEWFNDDELVSWVELPSSST